MNNNNTILYIKYAELTLKGKNRHDFINKLFKNIKRALNEYSFKIIHNFDNIIIKEIDYQYLDKIIEILQLLPGIHNINVAHQFMHNQVEDLNIFCTNFAFEQQNKGFKSFKIESRRQFKEFYLDSMQIKNLLATPILEKTELKVNVKHPDFVINVEVKNDVIIVYSQSYKGQGGLPLGIGGKVLLLLSGGIDSPVAAKLLMKRGLEVDFITFITPPHTSDKALQKVYDLSKTISLNGLLEDGKLYVCNFSDLQHELAHTSKESYRITLMRRCFLRLAKRLAMEKGYKAIATGEAIGQVASQTIESMQTITNVLDDFLVLRPLLTYDKEEIIKKAKEFKTFDLSILPYDDSCSLFAPQNPVTKPCLKTAIELEKNLDLLEPMLDLTYQKNIKIYS